MPDHARADVRYCLLLSVTVGYCGRYVCPITHELMCDPVMACDGQSYERRAIEQWFTRRRASPKTGCELETTALFPNHLLRNQICEWQEAHLPN